MIEKIDVSGDGVVVIEETVSRKEFGFVFITSVSLFDPLVTAELVTSGTEVIALAAMMVAAAAVVLVLIFNLLVLPERYLNIGCWDKGVTAVVFSCFGIVELSDEVVRFVFVVPSSIEVPEEDVIVIAVVGWLTVEFVPSFKAAAAAVVAAVVLAWFTVIEAVEVCVVIVE